MKLGVLTLFFLSGILKQDILGMQKKDWTGRGETRLKRNNKHYDNVEAVDILHQVSNFYVSTKTPIDYGTGELYTSVEVHMLKYIADHPGITVTELAIDYGKTKGAISQMLKKIEDKGLIYREQDTTNDNRMLIYVTEKGELLDFVHRKYDMVSFGESMDQVRALYSEEEIDLAFDILETWLNVRRQVHQKRVEKRRREEKERSRKDL